MRGRWCGLVLVVLMVGRASAGDLHATYVTADQIRLERVLPPPPEPDSPQQAADLAAVEAAVRTRTPADEKVIEAELPCTAKAFADDILGARFARAKVPLTERIVGRAFADTELAVLAAKQSIGRARPYKVKPDLATYGTRSPSASYPSGHAACGRVIAVVLAAMLPEKSRAFYARGEMYGHNRLVAGTHYPTDLVAGAAAGSIVADALFRDRRFQSDLRRATVELRTAVAN